MDREALDIEMIAEIMQFGNGMAVEYFLDRETGEVFGIPEEVFVAIENEEEDSLRPSQRSLAERARTIYTGSTRFVPVPHLTESDLYLVISDLCTKMDDPEAAEAVAVVLASDDFIGRFEELCLAQPDIFDLFNELMDAYTQRVMSTWLVEVGFVISRR